MKIAILSWTFYPALGGTQVFLYKLIEGLINKGNTVDIYLPSYCYEESKKYAPKGSKIIKLSKYENYFLKYFPFFLKYQIYKIQKKQNYDVWQTIGAYPSSYICESIKEICPIILRSHGEDIQESEKLNYGFGLDSQIKNKISQGLHNAKKLIALTNDVKNIYLKEKISENRIEIIPNGVDINPEEKIIENETNYRFITVGRAHPKKGYDLIPQVVKNLKKKNINFIWTVIGKGVKDLEYLNNLDLKNNLRLIEQIEPDDFCANLKFPPQKLKKEYLKHDIFIMTSYLETFGMVLIEALAHNLVVISSNSQGCRDVISDNYNGLLFENGNAQDLTNKILMLLNNSELKKRLLRNSKLDMYKYTWTNVINSYIKIYKEVIN